MNRVTLSNSLPHSIVALAPSKPCHPERSGEAWAEPKDLQYPRVLERSSCVRRLEACTTKKAPAPRRLPLITPSSLITSAALVIAALVTTSFPTHAVEIEGLPAPGAPHRAVVGTPVEKKLPNGLRVIVLERPGLPLLSAELIIKGGVETDPPNLSGLTKFTAALLKRGTKNRTAPQIAEDIEALGAKIDDEVAWDSSSLNLTTLAANAEPALGLLAELARDPAFAKDEIERARLETLDELKLSMEEAGTVGRLAAVRATLPADAHPATGTLASVARFTAKNIAAQHAHLYRPENAILVLAGDVKADDAFALVSKQFGAWTAPKLETQNASAGTKNKEQKTKTASAAKNAPNSENASAETKNEEPRTKDSLADLYASPRAVLIDMPTAGQAAVFLTTPSITRESDEWFTGKLATTVLGGGYSSRLNQEIRLKRGLSYGAGATLSTRRARGLFLASAQTKNESASEVVKVMQAEFARLATEPVPQDYLQTRKSVLTGALSRDLETNAHTVSRLGELALYDLPLNGLNEFFDNIERIAAPDLQTFAQTHLAENAFTIVIAGQAKIVEKPLRAAFPKLEVIPVAKLDLDSPTLLAPTKGKK